MAETVLQDFPELRPFSLPAVRLTGTRIGAGAYGSVEEVAIPGAICAAKKIHDFFLDTAQAQASAVRRATAQFVRECQLMSTLRHPHIVQFLGICVLPGSRLPALVMERLATSLHDLLEPDTELVQQPKQPFPLSLKCSVLRDVASGLAFLHERSPPIIHRDLSARNVLLNSGMVAKISDLGVARIVPRMRAAATMTKAPGAGVYMPPEALEHRVGSESEDEGQKSKYDASIDIFSFGVVVLFTLSQTFPCDLLAPTFRQGGRLLGRTELERRQKYMEIVYGQLHKEHLLVKVIEGCLDFPEKRPGISVILALLEQSRVLIRDEGKHPTQCGLNQISLQERQLNSGARENQADREQVGRREAELTREQERIVRGCHVTQDMRLQVYKNKQCQNMLYSCDVSGMGLLSATVNHPALVLVNLIDPTGRPHPLEHKVTAELKPSSQQPTTKQSKKLYSKKPHRQPLAEVVKKSPSMYEVSYTAVFPGQHKLHIKIDGREIKGSPFIMRIYSDPTQLGHPVRTITGLNGPYGIATTNGGDIVISERDGHRVSICNPSGKKTLTFGSHGNSSDQMKFPKGIAIDSSGNLYISSARKLQKFDVSGKLINCVSYTYDPCGLAIFNNRVYMCDQSSHCIRVHELDLSYSESIGSHGRGRGELDIPLDIKFDSSGLMFIAEFGNRRVQVMDRNGQFVRSFGQEGSRKLSGPTGLCVADRHVYVSDYSGHCVVVYETTTGKYVTSFGRFGWKEGQFRYPCCITSCSNGFIHVCDSFNCRVQIF